MSDEVLLRNNKFKAVGLFQYTQLAPIVDFSIVTEDIYF